jgi:hypothetical protein
VSISSAERLRLVVVHGATRRDLSIPLDVPLGDSLRRFGILDGADDVYALASDGNRVSLTAAPRDAVAEGGLVTLVDIEGVPQTARPTRVTQTRVSPLHRAAWWFAAVAAGMLVLASALGTRENGETQLSEPIRLGLAAVLGVAAFFAALSSTRTPGRGFASSLTVPPALAFAAAFVAVPPSLYGSLHLATTCGLIAAAVAASIVHLRSGVAFSLGATGIVLVSLALLAVVWAGTLFLGWPSAVPAALAIGFAPLALRILPSTCLDVPEGQFIEYEQLMSNRWTVRGRTPEGSRPVSQAQVAGMIGNARAQLVAGTIFFSALPAVFLPVVFGGLASELPVRIGALVLVIVVIVAFLLAPRSTRDPVLRWAPRAGAALVLLEVTIAALNTVSAEWMLLVASGVLVIALVLAVVSIPVSRGVRSLSLSRTADGLEFLAIVLALPAAFAAADLISIFRGVVSA